jgi:hypothetical protein
VGPGHMAGSAEVPGASVGSDAGYEMLILGTEAASVHLGEPVQVHHEAAAAGLAAQLAGRGYCSKTVESVGYMHRIFSSSR